jgi:hypothetical protein
VYSVKPLWIALLSIIIFSTFSLQAFAISSADDIDTNRPSFTDSPLIVPPGCLQLENGTMYQHSQHGINDIDMPENEIRLGLTNSTEFQMFTPNWTLLKSPQSSSTSLSNSQPSLTNSQTSGGLQTGITDLNEIGIKQSIKPLFKDLNLAFIGGVNAPIGKQVFSGTGVQPVLRTPWSKPVYGSWAIGGMQSLIVINSGRDVQWQNFWLINKSFGPRTSTFIEYAGFFTHHSTASNIIHFGVVRKLNGHNQVDLHFGFGLDKTAPAAFIGTGYSFRFDHLPLLN